MEKKPFFTFYNKEKNFFESHETSYGVLIALIKIRLPLSYVMQICGVISYLHTQTVLDLVVSSQVSFRSCPIFFMSGRKLARKLIAHFRLQRSQRGENLVKPAGSASNKIFGSTKRQWSQCVTLF